MARLGHGNITSMVLSADGTLLAISTYLGLWLYDVQNRKLLTFLEKGLNITACVFSECGEWLATSGLGDPTKIWDISTGNCLAEIPREERRVVSELAFTPDRKHLIVGGTSNYSNKERKLYCCVEFWRLSKELHEKNASVYPERMGLYVGTNPLVFSPDNRLLAFASPDGTPEPYNEIGYPVIDGRWVLSTNKIMVYEISTCKHITTLDRLDDISSISFSPCGRFIAGCDWIGDTRVWNIPDNLSPVSDHWQLNRVYQKIDDEASHYISYSNNGRLMSTVYHYTDDSFSVHDLENNETLYKHDKETGCYHPDYSNGVRLVFESENNVYLWVEGENQSVPLGHTDGVFPSSLLFSQDGKILHAHCWWDGILSWDATQPQKHPELFKPLKKNANSDAFGERYLSLNMSTDGTIYVTSGTENVIRLWELGSGTPMATFPLQGEPKSATFSPDKSILACRDNSGQITIWDVSTGKIYDAYKGEKSNIPALTFSPDVKYLVCHPMDIYDIDQNKTLDIYTNDDGYNFLAFSPDSDKIWMDFPAWGNDTIELWDFHRDEEVISISMPKLWQGAQIDACTFSKCGQYLACSPYSASNLEYIGVWDVNKKDEPIIIFELTERPTCLAFSPDNTLLASAVTSGTILLWDLRTEIDT